MERISTRSVDGSPPITEKKLECSPGLGGTYEQSTLTTCYTRWFYLDMLWLKCDFWILKNIQRCASWSDDGEESRCHLNLRWQEARPSEPQGYWGIWSHILEMTNLRFRERRWLNLSFPLGNRGIRTHISSSHVWCSFVLFSINHTAMKH